MAGHQPRFASNPPIIRHTDLTKSLTAEQAQPLLAAFLEKSRKAAYLHPDAWLYSDGVKFGPKAGPSGGWAFHHLRRIEAGLRGERLAAESKDDLIAKFGEDAVPAQHEVFAATSGEQEEQQQEAEGDDTQVDMVIANHQEKSKQSEKKRRKQEKKDRTEREKAAKKMKLEDSDAMKSGANTPYQDSMVGYGDRWQKDGDDVNEWQDKEEYEKEQKTWVGDVADRDPTNGRQVKSLPAVVKHDKSGEVIVPAAQKTKEEKAARKAAKKAKQAEEKAKRKG